MNRFIVQDKLFNIYCLFYIIQMIIHSKMSPKNQKKLQNYRVRQVVRRAYHIPFYKSRFEAVGIIPADIKTVEDLSKIPVLTKEEYREWMNEELKTEEARGYKKTYTSGSTGIPTTNIYPPKEYAYHYMMDMFCWIQGGYNPFFGKTLTCSPGDVNVGCNTFIQKIGLLRRDCFSMKWKREDIIKKINDYKPDFILGYSSELSYIAQYALENNLYVHKPSFYCAGGEHVMGEQETVLKAVFGEGMINYYGCTEMADFAYRAPGEEGYGIIQDSVALAVLKDGVIATEGNGSILATPLYRLRYPLINYAIGDIVNLGYREGLDYLYEINGREQDIFIWEDGSRTTHKDFWLISRTLKDVYRIRFIQDSSRSVIFQVVRDKKSTKTTGEMETYLTNEYRTVLNEDIDIKFQWLKEIPPDPNGKIRNMISRIKE